MVQLLQSTSNMLDIIYEFINANLVVHRETAHSIDSAATLIYSEPYVIWDILAALANTNR